MHCTCIWGVRDSIYVYLFFFLPTDVNDLQSILTSVGRMLCEKKLLHFGNLVRVNN